MSNSCAAIGCTNHRHMKVMSFHCFPHPLNKPKLCKVWIEWSNNNELFSKLSPAQIYMPRLCNEHFHRSQFTNDLKTRLNKNAVPTIFADQVYDVPTREEILAFEASNAKKMLYNEVPCFTMTTNRPSCATNKKKPLDLQNQCRPSPRLGSMLTSSLTPSILDPLANSEPVQIDVPNQDANLPNNLAVGEVVTQTANTNDNIPIVDPSKCPSSQRRPTGRTFIFRKSNAAAATRPTCETNEMKTLDLKNQFRPKPISMLMSALTAPISDLLTNSEPVRIDVNQDTDPPNNLAVGEVMRTQTAKYRYTNDNIPIADPSKCPSNQHRPTGQPFIFRKSNLAAALKVDLKPKKQVYPVHKHIVAAKSPILAAMFDEQTSGSETVNIIDTELNDNVLTEMLRYIYTGKMGHVRNMIDLLAAAEKYAIHELFTLCEKRIHISVGTAANVLVVADRHKAEDLKSRTVSFINSNFAAVVQTPGWDNMTKSQPHLLSFMYQQAMAALTKTTTEQMKEDEEEINDCNYLSE